MPYRVLDDGTYHVYNRWFEKMQIFNNDRDYVRFLERMEYLLQPVIHPGVKEPQPRGVELHAFCILPNHFHLILSGDVSKFPAFLGSLQNSYAKYFNTKYERRGQVFEGRYNAKLLNTDDYLSACLSYVTYNAIKHELVTDIRDWPWTSYHEIIEGIIQPHLPKITLLEDITIGEYVDIDEED